MPEGTVKWFNDMRGFGSITQPGSMDIFVHHTSIRIPGRRILARGDRVVFDIAVGPKGLPQAVNIRNIESPPPQGPSQAAT